MKKTTSGICLLLSSILLGVLITSACNLAGSLLGNSQEIKTVFSVYDIPVQTNPSTFFRINWSWEDKLTIQGFRAKSAPFFGGFVGDVTTGDVLPFYSNNSIVDGSIPLISEDGNYLAFQSEGKLYIVGMGKVTANNYLIMPDSYVDVLDTKFQCNNLAWSPDSRQLASVCQTEGKATISLYDLSIKRFQDVFEYSEEYIGEIEEGLSWSSDGTMLAFSLQYDYDNQPPQTDIFIYHFGEGVLTRITDTPGDDEKTPSWYPGSRTLTFASAMEDNVDVDAVLMFSTEDGKCMRQLPNVKGFVYPSWSPDGSQLAYISDWVEIKVLDTSKFVPVDFLSPQGLCNSK